ncbi:hypothetical protein BJX65DRAFT_311569 [Aspergillus insuetus]
MTISGLEEVFSLPTGTVIQIPGAEATLSWIITTLLFVPVTVFIYFDCIFGWVRLLHLAFFYSRESFVFAAFVIFAILHILYHNVALCLGTLEMSLALVFDVFDFFDILDMFDM